MMLTCLSLVTPGSVHRATKVTDLCMLDAKLNDIAKGFDEHMPPLDRAIATLIEDLTARGMLNDVIVYCVGEFGRTPTMNGHAGRDRLVSRCIVAQLPRDDRNGHQRMLFAPGGDLVSIAGISATSRRC